MSMTAAPAVILPILVLCLGHVFSNAVRTIPAIAADVLTRDLGISAETLAQVTGAFPLAFAAVMIPVGIALDRHGVKRVSLVLLTIAGCGAAMAAMATGPWSMLMAQVVVGAKQEAQALGHPTCIVGHVGDGNFHQMVLYDPTDPQGLERAWDMDRRIVERGLALGGTCSGEHGIGLGKREFLEREHGPEALAVMRSLKQALDLKGIMNPGKIFRN